MAPTPCKLLISYTHDSPEHMAEVRKLADRLRLEGVEVTLDQYVFGSPPEGWPRWMDRAIRESERIAVVCTESYCKRAEGTEEPGKGAGAKWESFIAYQLLYDAETTNHNRFIPVCLSPNAHAHIPTPLRSATRYDLFVPQSYKDFYCVVTQQNLSPAPAIGALVDLTAPSSAAASPPKPAQSREQDVADFCRQVATDAMAAKGLTPSSGMSTGRSVVSSDGDGRPEGQSQYAITLGQLTDAITSVRSDRGASSSRALQSACKADLLPLERYLRAQRDSIGTSAPDRAVALLTLSRRLAGIARARGSREKCYEYCLDILRIDPDDRFALDLAGDVEDELGELQLSRSRFQRLREISRKSSTGYGVATLDMSRIEYNLANLDSAEALSVECAEVFARTGNRRGIIAAYQRLGHIAARRRKYDLALEMATIAEEMYVEEGDRMGIIGTHLSRAVVFLEMDRVADARRTLEALDRRTAGDLQQAVLDVNLGLVIWTEGDLKRAKEWLERPKKWLLRVGHKFQAGRVQGWQDDIAAGKPRPEPDSLW